MFSGIVETIGNIINMAIINGCSSLLSRHLAI